MSSIWGKNIKLSLFGESHGKGIGIVIDGLPSGMDIDLEKTKLEMLRRSPKKDGLSTTRDEKDAFEIISGYYNGKITGTPLCCIIYNTDKKSRDYDKTKDIMRPGHADYTGHVRYSGFNDFRGGGHFSGRLTAPIVFAGSIAKQILEKKDIHIGSRVKSIGNIKDDEIVDVNLYEILYDAIKNKEFPVLNDDVAKSMKELILNARQEKDSVGGIVEGFVSNVPTGIGTPFFESVESRLAQFLFSIPGVKGVEFGAGFKISSMLGSQANDQMYYENKKIKTYSNNNGGIVGGITNGMPIIYSVAFKPTPSIAKMQKTVDISKKINTELEIEGRHDPCIVLRAAPVVEAATALVLLDMLIERERGNV